MFTAAAGYAQQDAQFTQYMYNTININPAYAGSRGAMSIFGLYRTQWVGMDGAPKTAAFSVNTPLNDSRLGIGVSVTNDELGPTVENTFSADLSYTVPVSENWKISVGLKGTANFFKLNTVGTLVTQDPDPSLFDYSKFSPNVGAGIYFHSEKTYIGLSVPAVLETKTKYTEISGESAIETQKMNYYLIAGHVFDLSPNTKFKPALLTKMVTGAPLQVDVSANFMLYDKLVLGAAYRWDAAVSALVGFQITDGLYIGYGYDQETTNLKRYNSGSHEIFLRYELFGNYNKIISPRFF